MQAVLLTPCLGIVVQAIDHPSKLAKAVQGLEQTVDVACHTLVDHSTVLNARISNIIIVLFKPASHDHISYTRLF